MLAEMEAVNKGRELLDIGFRIISKFAINNIRYIINIIGMCSILI